jgi:periplasmic protein TonB
MRWSYSPDCSSGVKSPLPGKGRGKWASRSMALMVITALHAVAIALAISARAPERQEQVEPPISVTLLAEQNIEAPAPRLQVPEVGMPEVVVPLIHVDFPQEAPPAPIAVMVSVAPQPPPAAPSPPPSPGDSSMPIMATSVEYLRAPVVSYPPAARQARASGTAHIRALVEADGRVREASVERSSGYPSLDKAARESVLGALFRPYMHNGIARAALVIVPVEFALKTRGAKRE